MDGREKHALDLIKAQTSAKLDPFPILRELLDREIINNEQYTAFLQDTTCANGDTMLWYSLFEHLQKNCSFLTLIDILMKTGQVGLAQMLLDLVKGGSCRHGIPRVCRIQTDKQKSIRIFFKNLKSQVHDATLKNPREALRSLAERYHTQLRCESNASRKHYLADKLVAILGVEIDAHAITFDDKLSRHELFDELKALVPASSNTMMTDLSYYGRLANANAIGGRFSEGRDMLVKAQCSASNFTSCLEVANMYYIQVYVLLWEFEVVRSQQLKYSLLEMAAKGIASLQDEDDAIRVLWTRMFLLRMIFCLLGIGNRANILPDFFPSREDMIHALNLLQKLKWKGIWKGIETRREMFYWVAMSRLNALMGNISEAKSSITTARKLAFAGKFKELTFIERYSEDLKNMSSSNLCKGRTSNMHQHLGYDTEVHPYFCKYIFHELNFDLSDDSNSTEDYGGIESYAYQNCLSRKSNGQSFEDGSFLLQQIADGKRFAGESAHLYSVTEGKHSKSGYQLRDNKHVIQDMYFPSMFDSPSHSFPFVRAMPSAEIISPYNSDADETMFNCSYLHHKEDSSVYLFHHASVKHTQPGSDVNNRNGQYVVTDTERGQDMARNPLVSSPVLDDDPYSSIDSELLFSSGTHEPDVCFSSLVLFEDRGEPEGDSMT